MNGWREEVIEGGEKVGIQDSSLCFGGVGVPGSNLAGMGPGSGNRGVVE